ncbi:hypothetical protein ACMA5K_22130 [Bradyrhizobium diazoefficiens]|uniref:hypothetical protein n=1 Tax=Bradyrhizobium diazoefficiens TaxID=1355477 RepID=UPI000BE8C207|nr:hypothetical protein [Bradyrhizobium diazoefficiens]PDT61811.1 hypothetical protein CO678_12825 [Bradyrhizobium diazoefficiens]QLD43484.1 hypothetical protein HUW42_21955 [Bradyrhizobium diazoefficiens]
MAPPEVTGRKPDAKATARDHRKPDAVDADAYSVEEFCRRHRISVQLFYKNRKQMPRTFNVGTRVLISKEAAAAWRHKRERAAQAAERVA